MFGNIDKINSEMSEHSTISDLSSLLESYTELANVTDEVQQFRDKCAVHQRAFENTLSESQRQLYITVENNNCDETFMLTHEAFILGYKVATRLLLKGMK